MSRAARKGSQGVVCPQLRLPPRPVSRRVQGEGIHVVLIAVVARLLRERRQQCLYEHGSDEARVCVALSEICRWWFSQSYLHLISFKKCHFPTTFLLRIVQRPGPNKLDAHLQEVQAGTGLILDLWCLKNDVVVAANLYNMLN